jgi:hypothetical protein
VGDSCRSDKRLAGYATGPQAIAADSIALDSKYAKPNRCSKLNSSYSGRTKPNNYEIELIGHL